MATFGNLETEVEPLASLMREHVEAHALVEATQAAVEAALEAPHDENAIRVAASKLKELEAYSMEDLVLHIAKEEEALFPALRGFGQEIDQVLDEMVEQHDEIRMRQDTIERMLQALDSNHDEVDDARASFARHMQGLDADALGSEKLALLLDAVKRLNWILQGHFGDEEDDLFVPALELLSEEQWAEVARLAEAVG